MGYPLCCRGHRFVAIGPLGADFSPCFRKSASRRRLPARESDSTTGLKTVPRLSRTSPVSRQYEEEYYRGGETWGVGGFPKLRRRRIFCRVSEQATIFICKAHRLFSGYPIQTSEGAIGDVIDFIIDDKSWAICHLVCGDRPLVFPQGDRDFTEAYRPDQLRGIQGFCGT